MSTILRRVVLVLCMAGLAACASVARGPDAQAYVLKLAQQRIDAIAAGDFAKAYTFTTPGYQSGTSSEAYAVRLSVAPIRWIGGDALEATCTQTLCKVKTRIAYETRMPVPHAGKIGAKTLLHERWIFTKSGWRYLPER